MEEVSSLAVPPPRAPELCRSSTGTPGPPKESMEEARRGAKAEGPFRQECACTAPALRRRQGNEHLKDSAQAAATETRGASPTPGLGHFVGERITLNIPG